MVEIAGVPTLRVRDVIAGRVQPQGVTTTTVPRVWGRPMRLFVCLDCSKRRRTLYETEEGWRCLRCAGFTYMSQWTTYRPVGGIGSNFGWHRRSKRYAEELYRRLSRPGRPGRRVAWLSAWLERYAPRVEESGRAFMAWKPKGGA